MLELSWGGTKTHTNQGFNIGKPPYGYLAVKTRHPVRNKAEQGKTKHRLTPDPVRGPVVTQIFLWRAPDRIGYQAIADRLNSDLDRYPPPEAHPPGLHPQRRTPSPANPSKQPARSEDSVKARGLTQRQAHRPSSLTGYAVTCAATYAAGAPGPHRTEERLLPVQSRSTPQRPSPMAAEIATLQRRQHNLITELQDSAPSGDDDFDRAWRSEIQ
jgi:hypothetical protein